MLDILLQSTIALIFFFVFYVLIKQFYLTKAKEYLLFSIGFIISSITLTMNIFFDVSLVRPYAGDPNIDIYVLLLKITYLRNVIFWSTFFIIAYMSKNNEKEKSVLIIFFSYLIFLFLLILNLQHETIPEKSNFFGLTIYSTLESDKGVIIKLLDSTIIFGQGYGIILYIFEIICAGYYLWSLHRIPNTFKYKKFNFIKRIWLIIFGSFTIAVSILFLDPFFDNMDLFPIYLIFAFVSVISLFIAVIIAPEGLILSKVSMSRVINSYRRNISNVGDSSQSMLLNKTLEYIKYVEKEWDR